MYVGSDGVSVLEQRVVAGAVSASSKRHDLAHSIPLGEWARIDVEEDFRNAKVVIAIDGVEALVESSLACSNAPGNVVVDVGYVCLQTPMHQHRANFDDITLVAD